MADGKVVFQIDGDARGVKTTIKDVTADIEKESKKWDKAAEQSTGNIEGFFGGMLKGIVGAISAAGIAKLILDWGKAAVSAASDLAEVQNVVDVTFGDSAKKIDTWAQSAGNNFGLTETQAKRYASTIGAMLKSQDVAQNEVLDMSESLAGLAADMASFYNLDFDTAFEKIRAGITGETMPLKQLGINMSVANLEAFALEQGITKSYAAMSQGEQTLIRYQYLMKATADAQGDFARTSDGMANASRRVTASLETIKTKGGALLLQVIEPLTTGFADILETLTSARDKTALDIFGEINNQTAKQLADLETGYRKATDIMQLMDKMRKQYVQGTSVTYESLFSTLRDVENSGGKISEYLQEQGYDVDTVTQKYLYWQEAVKQLTALYPSLAQEIEQASYAGSGSVEALQDDFDAFKGNEEKKLAYSAYYSKQRALNEIKAQQYVYQFDSDAAVKNRLSLREQMVEKYGEKAVQAFDNTLSNQRKRWSWEYLNQTYKWNAEALPDYKGNLGFTNADTYAYFSAIYKAADANFTLQGQTNALTEAEAELKNGLQALEEKYGPLEEATESATESTYEWIEAQKDAGNTALAALQALGDYAESVYDATEKSIDSMLKGFAIIERPTTEMEEKRSKLIEQQNELNRSTKDGAKRYEELQTQIDELNKSLDAYSPKGMQDALQSQLAFMDEYIKNLEKAQQMGLSNDLLASLSDGSVQSAEYLASLVANPEQAKEVDALYQQVQQKKGEFAGVLTDQKLTVDETYQGMVTTAQEAISALNLGDEASDAMGNTVEGIAQGIAEHIPEVKTQVDALIAQLNRIGGIDFSFDFAMPNGVMYERQQWSFGDTLTGDYVQKPRHQHETGLDYVPFDGYLASLHEGESILTAEENRIWQRFKNGAQPQTMDYDALGATMRENVQAGGNVYLDGKTVGRVISDQQGNSYRQLQRSGWQG